MPRGRGRPPKDAPPEPSNLPDLIELWDRAARSERGIVIESSHANALTQQLYAARRLSGSYHELRLVEDEDKVWIVPR